MYCEVQIRTKDKWLKDPRGKYSSNSLSDNINITKAL